MAYPKGTRSRTIVLPEERAKAIRIACEYLGGISGQRFISDAITEHLRATYERMLNDIP